jgi:anti-sigma factor RsiW
MSGHLEELAAALADGELDHDARDRALAHITGCAPCRAAVDEQRRLKSLIANQPDPEVSAELAARLTALARNAAGHTRPDVVRNAVPSPSRPRGARPRARNLRSLRGRAATVSALGVALVAGVAAAGGGSDAPRVRPPVATFVDEHNATTNRRLGPLTDPAGSVVLTSYAGR